MRWRNPDGNRLRNSEGLRKNSGGGCCCPGPEPEGIELLPNLCPGCGGAFRFPRTIGMTASGIASSGCSTNDQCGSLNSTYILDHVSYTSYTYQHYSKFGFSCPFPGTATSSCVWFTRYADGVSDEGIRMCDEWTQSGSSYRTGNIVSARLQIQLTGTFPSQNLVVSAALNIGSYVVPYLPGTEGTDNCPDDGPRYNITLPLSSYSCNDVLPRTIPVTSVPLAFFYSNLCDFSGSQVSLFGV